MLFELRQYRIKNDQRDRWVRLMEEKIVPFQTSKGIVVIGTFIVEDDPDLFVWIRRFDDEDERERLYLEVYGSDYWKKEISPLIQEMLDRETISVTRLNPTPKSVIR